MSLSTRQGNCTDHHETDPIEKDYLCQVAKDNVEDLLHTWSTYSSTLPANDSTLLAIAAEICTILTNRSSFNALEVFLQRLPSVGEYKKHKDILRARIALALHQRKSEVVQEILKNNSFEESEDLIKAWDESNYIEEENRLQKSLTPLARFRVRKRHPPPKTICPTGMRKMASLPKGATRILKQWLIEHFTDPYPSGDEKNALAKLSGLTPNQVKTWFANARRRIHKGGDLIPAKRGGSSYVMKEQHDDNDLMSYNATSGVSGNVSLPSDSSSLFIPCIPARVEHSFESNEYEKIPMSHSYRCVHSLHNGHACFHGQELVPENTIEEYNTSSARCVSHAAAVNGNLPVYPTPSYAFPRWSTYAFSPVQHRHDEFETWYKGSSFQSEPHGHFPNYDSRVAAERFDGDDARVPVERLSVMENGFTTLMDSYFQSGSELQDKVPSMHTQSSKDELTEMGAARILADLSSKQPGMNYDFPVAPLPQANH